MPPKFSNIPAPRLEASGKAVYETVVAMRNLLLQLGFPGGASKAEILDVVSKALGGQFLKGVIVPHLTLTENTPADPVADTIYKDTVLGSAGTDHGGLIGLTDDDHTQYLLANGTRTASHLQLDLAFAGAIAEGQLNWNSDDGTVEFGLPGGNVTLQVGQELLIKCVNKTGVTINDGEAVYISGASGSRPEITLADASDTSKDKPIGLATEDIGNNLQGYVNIHGLVRDFDTSGLAAGGFGYLSEATPGALRATTPGGTNAEVILGVCIVSSVGSGIFLVNVRDQMAGHTTNTDTDVSGNSWVIDEDNMVSDLATKVPTQQSVKAYVDSQSHGGGGEGAKVWIRFDGTGTIAIDDSFNVTSITDNGATGDYSVTIATNFANADYAVVASAVDFGAAVLNASPERMLAGSFAVLTYNMANAPIDADDVSCVAFGAQ